VRICVTGPVSLRLLGDFVESRVDLPAGYEYPLAAYLVRHLLNMGHEVGVVTSVAGLHTPRIFKGERLTLYLTPRRRHYLFCLDAYRRERREMVKAIIDFQPDVVHAQWTYEFAHAAHSSGYPYVVTARDSPAAILKFMPSPYRLYRYLYAKWLIPKLNRITTISPYMQKELETHHHLKTQVSLVPNGLQDDMFASDPAFRPPANPPTLVSISGWGPRKNISLVLEGFSLFRAKIPGARLILIGNGLGPNGPAEALARKRGWTEGVDFQGKLSHPDSMALLRENADIFVHGTLEESFCMTVVEAMAQGRPVLAAEGSGAIPWLLEGGRCGFLVPPAADAFFHALLDMMENPGRVQEVSKRGHERAWDAFRMSMVAGAYLEVYKSL